MTTKTEQQIPVTEDQEQSTDTNGVPVTQPQPVPVIYEEVVLTEEAAEILERLAREHA
jgi:hypothetical protein